MAVLVWLSGRVAPCLYQRSQGAMMLETLYMPDASGSQHPKPRNEGRKWSHKKGTDTVGQPPSTEIGVLNMPSLKAK
jgi:hypothetical protein